MTLARRILSAAALWLALSGPALAAAPAIAPLDPADQALVARASAYLQAISQVQARFTQVSPRGAVSHGDLYIKRPGRARFAYDPPSGLLVVSDGYNVSVYDQRLKTFDQYPLGATPLSLFLARNVRLDKGVVVSRVDRTAQGFTLIARDGRREAEGRIALTFSDNPIALQEWVVTDAQGQSTHVALEGLHDAPGLDPRLFGLRNPLPHRTPGRP